MVTLRYISVNTVQLETTDRITCDRCDASILLLLQPGHEGLTMHFNLLTASSTPTPIADDKNRKAKQSSIHYCITGHLISVQECKNQCEVFVFIR
ncbi:unnamed protein product [Brugia pahangi]|uniref:Uncharacterized protein n=1 Tax=Brugia pahangi TaxID=6280 RepID=A0A0N4TWD2_BRUPA|nr:unnamed protein product [Brugia pahangi]